jgi:hypothetical protein
MKPEIAEIRKDALDRVKRAEKYFVAGEFEFVKSEAKNAATSGLIAITLFLRGREDDKKAAVIASEEALFEGFFEEWENICYRQQDYIAETQKILTQFFNLSENELPFE